MPDFVLPDLGEGLTEAEIVRWLVAVGDTVAVDQTVVEVETAKAVVDVPSPYAGVVTALHGAPGEVVPAGAALVTVDTGGAEAGNRQAPEGFAEPGVVTPDPGAAPEEHSGHVLVGYGTAKPGARARPHAGWHTGARAVPGTRTPGVISPLVRRLARDTGVDLAAVQGSGPGGIVRRRDVEEAVAATETAGDGGVLRRVRLHGARKTLADRMTRSRREIPEATVWVDVDASGLLAARAELNARAPERKVSLLALVARFAVVGLRRYPELNARIEGDEIVLLDAVHLGFAAQTDRGLVVPVVRDAQNRSTRELADAMGELTATARAGRLTVPQLTGGTFTVNNYGVFGVDGSAAVINHPEVAMLGVGRIMDRPWVVDGQLTARPVCELTLAFDHRVCDGGTAGGFLRFVADCVESPVHALGEL